MLIQLKSTEKYSNTFSAVNSIHIRKLNLDDETAFFVHWGFSKFHVSWNLRELQMFAETSN